MSSDCENAFDIDAKAITDTKVSLTDIGNIVGNSPLFFRLVSITTIPRFEVVKSTQISKTSFTDFGSRQVKNQSIQIVEADIQS